MPFTGGYVLGGRFALRVFGWGSFMPRYFFHRQMLCRVGDFQRCRHGLIREGAFAKGASNTGAVVTEALDTGPFGSG